MKYLVAIFALALVLSAGAAWANPAVDDGLIPDLPHPGASDTFVTLSGGGAWDGVYDYDAGPGVGHPWINIGGDPTSENITVTCDIELYAYEWMSANTVYFHLKGDTYAPMSAIIAGLMKSNNGENVGIELPVGKTLMKLVGAKDGFGRDVAASPGYHAIDVAWELSENGTTWRTADTTGMGTNNTVYAMWWLLANGQPCDHPFWFRITISPEYHQVDGHYTMDPTLVVDPVI